MTKSRELQLALSAVNNQKMYMRTAAKKFNVPYSTIWDNVNREKKGGSKGHLRGRKPFLTPEDEQKIAKALLLFAKLGIPLRERAMRQLVAHYVAKLPHSRLKSCPFRKGIPGRAYIRGFLRRNPDIKFRRRACLEQARHDAMSPYTLAKHYARLQTIYNLFKITSPEQVINLDESGISTKTDLRGKGKAAMHKDARQNAITPLFSANAEHLTIMPVVSADGTKYTSVVVLPGTCPKFRIREDRTVEFVQNFLPPKAKVVHRSPASMTAAFFEQWARIFVKETTELRQRFEYLVVIMDGFTGHASMNALFHLYDNNILAVALPSHTSHRLQALDYSVFSPFKNAVQKAMDDRMITHKKGQRNDVFTLCELVYKAYREALTQDNIINGFDACGIWSVRGGGANANAIKACDISNIGDNADEEEAFANYMDLYKSFVNSRDILKSDGPIFKNGHFNTHVGILMNGDEARAAFEEREQLQLQKEKEDAERAEEREQRVLDRLAAEAEKQKQRKERERIKEAQRVAREEQEALKEAARKERETEKELARVLKEKADEEREAKNVRLFLPKNGKRNIRRKCWRKNVL